MKYGGGPSQRSASNAATDHTRFEARRLREEHKSDHPHSWIAHVGAKTWVDVDDFTTAYYVACAMHGKRLTRTERAMLEPHHAKAKVKELRRPYYEKAREALGINSLAISATARSDLR